MKKLRLDVEDLAVETFITSGTEGVKGTVEGHATGPVVCPTRAVSCNGTACPIDCTYGGECTGGFYTECCVESDYPTFCAGCETYNPCTTQYPGCENTVVATCIYTCDISCNGGTCSPGCS
jgi:hypothetical protein